MYDTHYDKRKLKLQSYTLSIGRYEEYAKLTTQIYEYDDAI